MDAIPSDLSVLRALIPLAEKRERLLHELSLTEAEMRSLLHPGAAPLDKKPRKTPTKKKRARGALRSEIVNALKLAGPAGVSVAEIAAAAHASPKNVHVWFGSTGKTISEIRRIGRGVYSWITDAPPAPASGDEPAAQS